MGLDIDDFKGKVVYKARASESELEFTTEENAQNMDLVVIPQVEKLGKDAWRLTVHLQANREMEIKELLLDGEYRYLNLDRVFVNGFQSWTETREYAIDEKIPNLSKMIWDKVQFYGDYSFQKYPEEEGYFHGYTYSYIRQNNGDLAFFGSLDESNGYTVFEHKEPEDIITIRKECAGLKIQKKYLAFDLIIADEEEKIVFGHYWDNAKWEAKPAKTATGWTSWYYHYTDISEKIILDNLQAFREKGIPLDYFQIDDGYQKSVGDWLETNKKFPNGMKPIAEKIHEADYKAGLWLAPFICQEQSDIYKNHRDWLLSADGENPVKTGFNPLWGGLFKGSYYSLDFYNEEVRDYLKKVFDTVLNDWEFDMVKLDFLFGAAILPKNGKTRGQIMSEVMDFLDEVCGDKTILACGVPLAPAFGKVEYCRIGPDIGKSWQMTSGKMMNMRERISTENAIENTIYRRHLHKQVFKNDPDVFMLRDDKCKLDEHQKHTLFLINHIFGGLAFTSDDIREYDGKTLDLYKSVFPHHEKEILSLEQEDGIYEVRFKMQDSEYLLVTNFTDDAQKYSLPGGKYYYRERGFLPGRSNLELEAFQSHVFLKCPEEEMHQVAGGTLHLFPGGAVRDIVVTEKGVEVKLHDGVLRKGIVYITMPSQHYKVKVNGKVIPGENIYGLNLVKAVFE